MLILPYSGVWPRIAEDAFIAPTAVIVGDVTIAACANIWFGVVIRGDNAPITIGERTNVQDGCVLHTDEGAPVTIGSECSLGHGAVVHGATIGDGALIGMRATVLNLAMVGAGCLVAAATLVPEGKQFAPSQLVMGVPGKTLRAVTEAEQARIRDGVAHYLEHARAYAAALASSQEDQTAKEQRP